jgi:hypothetical protein
MHGHINIKKTITYVQEKCGVTHICDVIECSLKSYYARKFSVWCRVKYLIAKNIIFHFLYYIDTTYIYQATRNLPVPTFIKCTIKLKF